LLEEEVPGGAMWSHVLHRHQTLRLTDLEGGANAAVLLYNRDLLTERYNMPDTLKAQHTAFLTSGYVMYSDMGRILCSITGDSCGWHDTVAGVSDAALVAQKYGKKSYQEARNGYHKSGRDTLLGELSKWGMGARDLVPNASFFSKVVPDAEGKLSYVQGHSKAGAHVDLRAEMNVLVVMSTCAHPLDPAPSYAPKKVGVTVFKSDPPGADDRCRLSRAENARGFINTERMFLGVGEKP
jgi:urea carboxylase-associated protein 2